MKERKRVSISEREIRGIMTEKERKRDKLKERNRKE